MTKERKLAVRMWREIAEGIRNGDIKNMVDVRVYKDTFCGMHAICWDAGCWFCEYSGTRHKHAKCEGCLMHRLCGYMCSELGNPYYGLTVTDRAMEFAGEEEVYRKNVHSKYADMIADMLEGKYEQ